MADKPQCYCDNLRELIKKEYVVEWFDKFKCHVCTANQLEEKNRLVRENYELLRRGSGTNAKPDSVG